MRLSRYVGWTIGVAVISVAAIIAAAGFTAWRSSSFREVYVTRSKHNLTAAECLKEKGACNLTDGAPIGALADYRRCGDEIAGSRARGEPLGCSAHWVTDYLLRDWFRPGQSAYRQLRRGCRVHDLCYRHGAVTYASGPRQCDREFLAESLRECWLIYGKDNKFDWQRDPWRWSCQVRAGAAYLGVLGARHIPFAPKYYQGSKGAVCDYEGGPHAARDQVVSGRFLNDGFDYVVTLSLVPDRNTVMVQLLSFGSDGQSREEKALLLSPDSVVIGDREWACQRRRTREGGFAKDCPEHLGQSTFEAADWLRFAPIVVDADGDGSDELVVPSVTPDFGLIFTHIRMRREQGAISFEPARAFLGVARLATDEFGKGGCEAGLEFANCDGAETASPEILSNDKALQNAGYQFTTIANIEAGCLAPKKQDIVLASSFSDFPKQRVPEIEKQGGWDGGFVLRRFIFDTDARLWHMRRDKFNNDWHRMAGCNLPNRDTFQTHARLQYPSFMLPLSQEKRSPLIFPELTSRATGAPTCTGPNERLALISRDKCPTTTPTSKAGNLNDIDLLLYEINPTYPYASDEQKYHGPYASNPKKHKDWSQRRQYDELRMAEADWKPILWPETADPVLTLQAARKHEIVMVAAFIGGTYEFDKTWTPEEGRPGQHPVIAVLRAEHLKLTRPKWSARYADSMGHAPDLYGVFKSSSAAKSRLEGIYNLWDPRRYGPAEMYFSIPSVLAPFTTIGTDGVSVVFLATHALWENAKHRAKMLPSKPLPIAEGHFRLMIVPIPVPNPSIISGQPAMIDCPAAAIAAGPVKPAAPIGNPNFLRREPVLTGKFYGSDAGGGLAVAWRDVTGGVKLTALRYLAQEKKWKFGDQMCGPPKEIDEQKLEMDKDELFRDRLN